MEITTGVAEIDGLIGGLQIGDNVVWQVVGPVEQAIIRSFVTSEWPAGLVYVTFTEPATDVLGRYRSMWRGREVLLLDCFTKDGAEPVRQRGRHRIVTVGAPKDPAKVIEALRAAEAAFGPGTIYLFDNLTAVQDVWGQEEALRLFVEHCPRLYELRTVAFWLLRKEAHDSSFLARLQRTTQVVFDAGRSNGGHLLRVVKAAGRPDAVGRVLEFTVEDANLKIVGRQTQALVQTGETLRAQRLARGISQAELARRLGITPSALSQAESGVRGLSQETLSSAYQVLGTDVDKPVLPYSIARRRARRSSKLAPGLTSEVVLEDPSRMAVNILEFAAGSSGRRPPFATKQKEVVVLLSGVLELRIGAATEVLQAGDAIVLRDEPVGGWSNPGSSPARVVWCILPPSA